MIRYPIRRAKTRSRAGLGPGHDRPLRAGALAPTSSNYFHLHLDLTQACFLQADGIGREKKAAEGSCVEEHAAT